MWMRLTQLHKNLIQGSSCSSAFHQEHHSLYVFTHKLFKIAFPNLLETNEELAPPMVGLNTRTYQPFQQRHSFGLGPVFWQSEIAAAGIEE